jgi:hypothetical protein
MDGCVYMRLVLFSFLLWVVPILSYSSLKDFNTEKDAWYLSLGGKVEREIVGAIEDSINDLYSDGFYDIINGLIEDALGKKFSESLSGMISIGPFLKIDNLIGSVGKSESQIMTEMILRAIDEAKEEIILAVEQGYRDETRAKLNSIISNYHIYNAMSEAERFVEYWRLAGFIADATYVRERIALKPVNYLEDIHPYLTISSLQIMMQKEYSRWLNIHIDEDVSEQTIEENTAAVLRVLVGQINGFFIQTSIGTMAYWENAFASEFSNDYGSYVGVLTDVEVDNSKYITAGSQRYAYTMGGESKEFSVFLVKDECGFIFDEAGHYNVIQHYDVYDVAGGFVKTIYREAHRYQGSKSGPMSEWICEGNVYYSNNMPSGGRAIFAIPADRSYFVPDVRNKHKDDVEAFNTYLVDGYLPIKRSLDEWWSYGEVTTRPMSEVDIYIQNNIEVRPDISVTVVDGSDYSLGPFQVIFRVSNVGGSLASNVVASVPSMSQYDVTLQIFDSETGLNVDEIICTGGPIFNSVCDLGSIAEGEGLDVLVSIEKPSGWGWPFPFPLPDPDRFSFRMSADGHEINEKNNYAVAHFSGN